MGQIVRDFRIPSLRSRSMLKSTVEQAGHPVSIEVGSVPGGEI